MQTNVYISGSFDIELEPSIPQTFSLLFQNSPPYTTFK